MKSVARTGLLAVALAAATLAGTTAVRTATAQTAPKAYAETQYPVILVHGVGGAARYSGGTLSVLASTINAALKAINPNLAITLPSTDVDYWYGFKSDLQRNGAKVYVANLEAFNAESAKDPYLGLLPVGRGEQLLQYVNTVLAQTGAKKVNLIGHDQGGMTARYVASVAPEKVASVTTIGTPHKGSELIDEAMKLLNQQKLSDTVMSTLTLTSQTMTAANGTANFQFTPFQSAKAAFTQLTTQGAKDFTAKFPSAGLSTAACTSGAAVATVNGNTQRLYSYNGAAMQPSVNLFGYRWVDDTSLSWILDRAQWSDVSTLPLRASGLLMANLGAGANDGMVSSCSAMYGKVIGTYRWNHLDEINQFLGIRGGKAEDPVAVMRTHFNRLQNDGV